MSARDWTSTRFTERFGCRYPIVQGPMGGGASTPELVAAVSNAGGLGSFGCYHLEPAAILRAAADIRRLTSEPFNLNLWIPREQEDGGGIGAPGALNADTDVKELWGEEAKARYRQIESGEVTPIPSDDVLGEARSRLK